MIYFDKSNIHGRGVFSKVEILKDTLIEKIPYLEVKRENIVDENLNKYTFGISKESVGVMFSYSSLINHSDTPNCIIKKNEELKILELYSLIDIDKNEELTIKYGEDVSF